MDGDDFELNQSLVRRVARAASLGWFDTGRDRLRWGIWSRSANVCQQLGVPPGRVLRCEDLRELGATPPDMLPAAVAYFAGRNLTLDNENPRGWLSSISEVVREGDSSEDVSEAAGTSEDSE